MTATRTAPEHSTSIIRPPTRVVIAVIAVMIMNGSVILLRQVDLARAGLLIAVLVFAALVGWCRRAADRLSIRVIMIITALCQLPGLLARPQLSDDAYRYVWDGRVQLAGISPYAYTPDDPALTWLRDPVLFPPGGTLINRSWVHTIYPPVAELWFTMVAAVTPWRLGTLGVQIGAALLVVITTGLLARVLLARDLPAGAALLYGACPAVALEGANAAHVDVLAALLLVATGSALISRRRVLAGLLFGLAIGVKLVPLLLLPVFLRRLRVAGTALVTTVAGYLPHLLAVGPLVIGFLPGYLQEEGFDGRRRFALLIFLPEQARLPVALALAAGLAVLAVLRSRQEPVLITCCWLYGAAFLIATPTYPWYLLPFMVIVIMAARWEWLLLWPAAYLGYLQDREPLLQTVGFGLALIMILVISRRRAATASAAPE